MQMDWKVNQSGAALLNRKLVLNLLRGEGPLSRRQLAERTGLRSSSLTYITRDLIDQGVVRTRGKLDKPGGGAGKKQVLLEIDPDLGWVLGVGIEGGAASIVMLDGKGQVIDRDRLEFRDSFELMPQLLKNRVDNWVTRHGSPPGNLMAVGLGMTGVIDPHNGIVIRSTRFQLVEWDLGQALSKVFKVPVRIDNDSNFAALAESREGHARDIDNFLHLLINSTERGTAYSVESLGSSIFINGDLYRGSCFGAGEIDSLIEKGDYDLVTAEQLLDLATHDGPIDDALRKLAEHIARTLVPIVDLLDPSAIVIGGNLSLTNEAVIRHIENHLNECIVKMPHRAVTVRPSLFMDHGVSMGAAISALDEALTAKALSGESEVNPGAPREVLALFATPRRRI